MIITREMREEKENSCLAPYGIRSKDSKGRKYPDSTPIYRTAFSVTGIEFCTQPLFAGWNTKHKYSSTQKAIITAPD